MRKRVKYTLIKIIKNVKYILIVIAILISPFVVYLVVNFGPFFVSLIPYILEWEPSEDWKAFKKLNRQIKTISGRRFFLEGDGDIDRIYIEGDSFFEMPALPYGLYLYYHDWLEYPNEFPYLSNLINYDYILVYNPALLRKLDESLILVQELYVYVDKIVVCSEKKYICIYFSDILTRHIIESVPDNFNIKYKFIKQVRMGKYIKYLCGVHDRKFLKDLGSKTTGTPIIGAIKYANVCRYGKEAYLVGESLYGFFSLSLKTKKGQALIVYYRDESDFRNFLGGIGHPDLTLLNISPYDEITKKKIEGKERKYFYEVATRQND